MDICVINGKTFDVHIVDLSEGFTILYSENSGRTISQGARMSLDPLGTFFSHKVTFARKTGKEEEYDELFDYLSVPRYDGIPVRIVHGQKNMSYEAYVSNGERALKRVDVKTGKVYWDKFTANFIPMEAQVLPL